MHNCTINHIVIVITTMVICVIVGCSNRSDCSSSQDQSDEEKVRFFSIPTVTCHQGKEDYELRKKQRDGFLVAISREDLDIKTLHKYKICSKHFILKRPAYLYDYKQSRLVTDLTPRGGQYTDYLVISQYVFGTD